MDELLLNVQSTLLRGILEKVASKKLNETVTKDGNVQIQNCSVSITEGRLKVKTSMEIDMPANDILRIIAKYI